MNPWIGKSLFFVWIVATSLIRAPYIRRSRATQIAENRRGPLEIILLILVAITCFVLPVIAIATHVLVFADYPLRPSAFFAAILALGGGLWLFQRSHADLGRNWSETLQIREHHAVISSGVYAHIRHPMYASLFLMAVAQALYLSNWIAGPAGLVGFAFMFAFRLGPEERMMLATFGKEYESYRSRTKRLIPGVW